MNQELETSQYSYEISGAPDFSKLDVNLKEDQSINVEASSMIAMDTNLEMETKFSGSFSRFLTGESLFVNKFQAKEMSGSISIASSLPGDIKKYSLKPDESLFIQSMSFLASSTGVEVKAKYQGLMKGFFSGAGLFLAKCTGEGDVFFNSFGAMIEIDIDDHYYIDNNHIVAFTSGLEYEITKISGYKSLFFSGEGLVTKFSGKGRIWIQTKKFSAFANWLYFFRPKSR